MKLLRSDCHDELELCNNQNCGLFLKSKSEPNFMSNFWWIIYVDCNAKHSMVERWVDKRRFWTFVTLNALKLPTIEKVGKLGQIEFFFIIKSVTSTQHCNFITEFYVKRLIKPLNFTTDKNNGDDFIKRII